MQYVDMVEWDHMLKKEYADCEERTCYQVTSTIKCTSDQCITKTGDFCDRHQDPFTPKCNCLLLFSLITEVVCSLEKMCSPALESPAED